MPRRCSPHAAWHSGVSTDMPRINLLPWRDAQRKERKLAFLVALGVAALAAGVTAFAAFLLYGSMIEGQQRRNNELRVAIIEKLQRSRPEIVHVFEEIVRTLPEGVYLTSVKQNAMRLKFEGIAQSSTRVSSFMRNLDGSQWLRNPELEVVQTSKGAGPGSSFTLTADQVTTAGPDSGSSSKAAKGKIRKASAGGREARQ